MKLLRVKYFASGINPVFNFCLYINCGHCTNFVFCHSAVQILFCYSFSRMIAASLLSTHQLGVVTDASPVRVSAATSGRGRAGLGRILQGE